MTIICSHLYWLYVLGTIVTAHKLGGCEERLYRLAIKPIQYECATDACIMSTHVYTFIANSVVHLLLEATFMH